jgi:glycosyltransferase involved in cell wall biosynthesis
MRIGQIAPLHERVPPRMYGGTERVVHALTEELVRRGHEVTLFASGDSTTSARLVPMLDTGARLGGARDTNAAHMAMLEEIFSQAHQFDILHAHVDVLAFPFARHAPVPVVNTMHGRLDLPEQRRALERYSDLPLVSISDSQRDPVHDVPLSWCGRVYNGIAVERFTFSPMPDQPPYLMFLGRIAPEKGPVTAIKVAQQAGIPLKIAAKIDPADKVWAEEHVLPLIDQPGIEFLGVVDEKRKIELLGGALALLFPIDWPEPFGMVLAESLACGTPVVALPGGAVEEILVDGVNGFICRSPEEMVEALGRIDQIERAACRTRVQQYYSAARMADGYEEIYRSLIRARSVDEDRALARLFSDDVVAVDGHERVRPAVDLFEPEPLAP